MKPYKMQEDMFEFLPNSTSHPSGLRRIAPVQTGAWWLEPYYAHCFPIFIEVAKKKIYTANGYNMAASTLRSEMLDQINTQSSEESWPINAKFLHALRFHTVRDAGKDVYEQGLLIVDVVIKDRTYAERRAFLEQHFRQLGIRQDPLFDEPCLIPRFDYTEAHQLWAGLHLENGDKEDENEKPLYQGIIEKRASSPYLHRSDSTNDTAMSWIAHPFANLS